MFFKNKIDNKYIKNIELLNQVQSNHIQVISELTNKIEHQDEIIKKSIENATKKLNEKITDLEKKLQKASIVIKNYRDKYE